MTAPRGLRYRRRCRACIAESWPRSIWHLSTGRALVAMHIVLLMRRALPCGLCRLGLTRSRGCARYNKPWPTDGKLTPLKLTP
jgi:hypothetical protein